MAHFARLTQDNIVTEVVVVSNSVLIDENGQEQEALGINFLKELYDWDYWKQTSYNDSFRKNYAGQGYVYDSLLDAFIPPKPFPSWLLDTDTCRWEAPVPYPDDGTPHIWDEANQTWV